MIYEDLCSFKSKSSSLLLQQQLNFQPKEKRDWVIKELIETEGSYVDVLNMLRKHFIRPISTMKVAYPNNVIQRSAKRRGCLLSYSQAEPGKE